MAVRLVVQHARSTAGEASEISFEFEQARIVIGRGPGADVRLPGLAVSDAHALIERRGERYALCDAGSTNGTLVNGTALVPNRPRPLASGDQIAIAEFTLSFLEGPLRRGPTAPERTASLARRMVRELMGEESAASEPPFLRLLEGPEAGTLINLAEPPSRFVIGRGDEADLVLTDIDVSRAHIELARDLDGVTARDLGSKNGLEVNGKRMRERRLRHGDQLRMGSSLLLFQDLAEQALRELERLPDLTLTRTRPSAPAPEQPEPEPAPSVPEAAELEAARPGSLVDLLVYALAAFVLAASLAGLVWLLG